MPAIPTFIRPKASARSLLPTIKTSIKVDSAIRVISFGELKTCIPGLRHAGMTHLLLNLPK